GVTVYVQDVPALRQSNRLLAAMIPEPDEHRSTLRLLNAFHERLRLTVPDPARDALLVVDEPAGNLPKLVESDAGVLERARLVADLDDMVALHSVVVPALGRRQVELHIAEHEGRHIEAVHSPANEAQRGSITTQLLRAGYDPCDVVLPRNRPAVSLAKDADLLAQRLASVDHAELAAQVDERVLCRRPCHGDHRVERRLEGRERTECHGARALHVRRFVEQTHVVGHLAPRP